MKAIIERSVLSLVRPRIRNFALVTAKRITTLNFQRARPAGPKALSHFFQRPVGPESPVGGGPPAAAIWASSSATFASTVLYCSASGGNNASALFHNSSAAFKSPAWVAIL